MKDLAASLRHGGAHSVQEWLQSVLDENEPGEDTAKAAELMQRLDQLAPVQEKLLLLDEAVYLHLQTTEGGYDYTLYDKDTLRQMDGGQLDAPELPLSTAALKICEMHDLGGQSIKYAPLAMIETLQEAAYQQMQEAAAQAAVPESTMLPDAPEQTLDEYPKIGMTIEEAADYTGIGRNTLRRLVDWGKIPVLRIGRKSIVRVDVICCFMQINEGRDLLDRNQVLAVD